MRATMTRVCLNRHSGGINMLFRDWSVRKVGLKENWTLNWICRDRRRLFQVNTA